MFKQHPLHQVHKVQHSCAFHTPDDIDQVHLLPKTTVNINSHIFGELQPPCFCFLKVRGDGLTSHGRSPALSKSSFANCETFFCRKIQMKSFSSTAWSPWQSLSGRPPRRRRESACWSQGRGFDCRAVPATHREALSFEIWVSGRKIFVSNYGTLLAIIFT